MKKRGRIGSPKGDPDLSYRVQLALTAFDKFDDIAIGVFDHGNRRPWSDLRFFPGKLDILRFQMLADGIQIGDDKGEVAKAQLLIDTDGPRSRSSRGIDELHIAAAKAQAMHGAGRGGLLADFLQAEQGLIKVQARLNIAANNTEINRVFGRLHHGSGLLVVRLS